jgi:Protein of unknown function (DUF2917)
MKKLQLNVPDTGVARVNLQAQQVVSTRHTQGLAIECLSGNLWVTFEGEHVDHLLSPGERMNVSGHRHVVIQALTSAEVAILPHAATPAAATPARRLGQTCRDTLHTATECWRNTITALSAGRLGLERTF